MRKFLAIVACKVLRFVGKLVGKGSSLPGKYALKICPDILRQVQLPQHIIAVTGSNGKTSTVEMIAAILRAGGKTVVYNEEGSNQVEGVTTLVLSHASLSGKVNADVLLIESDERYAAQSFKFFHPTEFVITNLYRDQLTRNGHPEWVYDAIIPAIHPYIGGCCGGGHASDFGVADPEMAYVTAAKSMAMTAIDLLANGCEKLNALKENFVPVYKNREEYLAAWAQLMGE